VLHKPELLLLDEPTSAVDPQSRRDFWDSLFELADAGTTLLVSTHYMDEAERCHRLAILDRGHLVADGSPAELMAALPGRVLRVESPNLRAANAVLSRAPGVVGSAQIGASLRVIANADSAGIETLAALLRAAGVEAHIQPVPPNLEDVFVVATKTAPAGKAAEGA
jgi:ABC-2 type transport system ATP-binding protein